jgi:hypothetical protein
MEHGAPDSDCHIVRLLNLLEESENFLVGLASSEYDHFVPGAALGLLLCRHRNL